MVFLQSVDILELCVILFYILCPFVYIDTCLNVTFHRRSEMDDLMFTGSLIAEKNQANTRAECFSQCQMRDLCNLVLYNPLTNTCRLHSEAFGSARDGIFESEWQYYGVSCANFRLGNVDEDADVIHTAPKEVCNANVIATDDNTSSCYTGASWEVVPVKCLPCYIGQPGHYAFPYARQTERLPFDLAAGMKLRLEVDGDTSEYNDVFFLNPTMDEVYVLSLRLGLTPTVALFTTKRDGEYDVEERQYGLVVGNISNYSIEIHIGQSAFETYVDGDLWMTNQMRLPFTDVRRVDVGGFRVLRSFRIGYELC